MTKSIIRRTYNVYGDCDYLVRLEGNCPSWGGDRRYALVFTEGEAAATVDLIATYRDWLAPNGIPGVSIVEA